MKNLLLNLKFVLLVSILSFGLFGCNLQNEVKSNDELLIAKINQHFKTDEYLTSHNLVNPYNEEVKDIRVFHKYIFKELQNKRQVNGYTKPSKKTAYASIFQFVNDDKGNLGINDAEDAAFVKEKLEVFNQNQNKQFDGNKFDAINNKMNTYSNDEAGVNAMLEDALKENAINETQSTILKSTLLEISKAKTLKEAIAINTTVEFEVLNSKIKDSDKTLILYINSIFANHFANQPAGISLNQGENPLYKKAAVVVAIVVQTIIYAAIGAAVGFAIGTIVCCGNNPGSGACNSGCLRSYVIEGAIVGGIAGAWNGIEGIYMWE